MAISNPAAVGNTGLLTTSVSTIALTTSANVPAGSKLWLVVTWWDASFTLSGVSDGTNTYTIDVQGVNGANHVAIVSADIPAQLNSGATITATLSGASVSRSIAAMYSSGVATGAGAAYGAVSQNQNSSTTWSSTSTTVTSGDILIGGSHWEDSVGPTNTASGGNTEVHDFTSGSGAAATSCYQIGTGAAIAASGTWTTICAASSGLRSSAVAYSAAAAAPVNAPQTHLPFIQQNYHSPI